MLILLSICFILTSCSLSSNENKIDYQYKGIDETFTYDEINITINSFSFNNYALSGSYYSGDDNIWLIINATLYNTSSSTKSLDEYTKSIIYKNENGDEAKYNSSFSLKSDFIDAHDSILAYGSINGIYCFKIPNGLASKFIDLDHDLRYEYKEPLEKGLYFQFSFNKKNEKNIVRVIL